MKLYSGWRRAKGKRDRVITKKGRIENAVLNCKKGKVQRGEKKKRDEKYDKMKEYKRKGKTRYIKGRKYSKRKRKHQIAVH